MKQIGDTSSRFRILKGGKVSLIVSGLLLGSGLNGADYTLTGGTSGLTQTLTSDSTLTITGDNTITGSSDYFVAISINGNSGTYSIAITNNGTLNVTNSNNGIMGINLVSINGGSSVTNNGTINVDDDGYSNGVQFLLEAGSTFSNTGTITVNANDYEDFGMTRSGQSDAIYITPIDGDETASNSGTITAKTNGVFDKEGYSLKSDGIAYGHALSFSNSGTMNGNINLSKGTFTNSGTLSLPHNANNASINNFVNEATGILEIGLQTDGTTTTYSKLATTNATFNSGSTINVNVLNTSTNVALLAGSTFADVVSATGTLTVNGTLNITDNSALLNFERVNNDATTIDIKAVQAQSVEEAVESGSRITQNGANSGEAARTLQTIVDNSGTYTQMSSVISALNGLSTNEQVARAVDSTTAQTTTSSFTASHQISANTANILTQRQNVNLNAGGLNSGDELLAQKNLWVKPYGSMAKQSNKEGVNGFDMNAYGLGIGVDGEYAPNQQIGVGLFYTRANVDVNNVAQTSDMDVYSLIVYGTASLIDDRTHLMYQAGYSWQDTASSRGIAFMGTSASADYTSKVASLDLKLLRDYKLGNDTLIQPLISTTYRYFKSPSYSESGAGALNLDVQEFSSNEFIVGAGALGYYQIDKKSRMFGNVNVGYDVRDDDNIVSSAYQGASGLSFNTSGIDNGRWSYDAGFGYESGIDDASGVSLSYNLQGEGSGFINHVVSAKYTYKF